MGATLLQFSVSQSEQTQAVEPRAPYPYPSLADDPVLGGQGGD